MLQKIFQCPKFANLYRASSTLFLFYPKRNLFLFKFHISIKSVDLLKVEAPEIYLGKKIHVYVGQTEKDKSSKLTVRWIIESWFSLSEKRDTNVELGRLGLDQRDQCELRTFYR